MNLSQVKILRFEVPYISTHTLAKSIYVWMGKAWEMEAKVVRPAQSGPPQLHWTLENYQHNVALGLVTRAYGVQHMAVPKIWQELYFDAEKWSCWPLCTKDSLQMRGRCRRASWAAKWMWDWIDIWEMRKGSLTDFMLQCSNCSDQHGDPAPCQVRSIWACSYDTQSALIRKAVRIRCANEI